MKDATDQVFKNSGSIPYAVAKKYASLLHILKGEEEFLLDQRGYIISSNLEAVNVTGYEEHEIIGKHISIFYQDDDKEKAAADLDKAYRLGSAIVSGLRVKKRGVIFWARVKIQFLATEDKFRVVLQDATHRAISKERIRTLREEYLAIFNNPFVGTFKFRIDDYAIQMCNQKTRDILKVGERDDLYLDQHFSSFGQFELFIATLRQEKKVEGFKFLLDDKEDHKENWGMVSARYFEQQGFAEGVLLDVTEQYCQMLELQRVNTELDNFIYHASHDLRSPLTTTMGLINLGLKETAVEVVHSYLTIIQARINHLDFLLKDLISVSYNNGNNPEQESFLFEDEANAILKSFSTIEKKIKVSVNISEEGNFVTDPVRMRTILRNLVSNSFKYFNPDATEPFVELKIRARASHCSILLKDNGVGIHPQFKNKVYNMFFRATERSDGSGLGLYIVKSMVEKLKGRISFESTLGEGTTFLVTIPNAAQAPLQNAYTNYFMVTAQQIKLVESSWDYILLNSNQAGNIFYEKLFSIAPEFIQLTKVDIHPQSQKLISFVTLAVQNLHSFHDIVSRLNMLGHRPNAFKVRPEHFAVVCEALLWTLSRSLGNRWNEETKQAWAAICNTLSKVMIETGSKE